MLLLRHGSRLYDLPAMQRCEDAVAESIHRIEQMLADLNASLALLHHVLGVARANYASAVAANIRMWQP